MASLGTVRAGPSTAAMPSFIQPPTGRILTSLGPLDFLRGRRLRTRAVLGLAHRRGSGDRSPRRTPGAGQVPALLRHAGLGRFLPAGLLPGVDTDSTPGEANAKVGNEIKHLQVTVATGIHRHRSVQAIG